jgi:hypothetical protein
MFYFFFFMLSVALLFVMLRVALFFCYAEFSLADCCYAACGIFRCAEYCIFNVRLSVVLLIIMLRVVTPAQACTLNVIIGMIYLSLENSKSNILFLR